MRPGGEKRGNSRDRKRRRAWLLATFDQDLGPDLARCWLDLSPACQVTVTAATLTVDRINPDGTYRRDNIQPACRPCQITQGGVLHYMTPESRAHWRALREEADAAGIEWTG